MALNDITLGQYYPADSVVHRLDPRVKIVLLIVLIVAIFVAGNLLAYAPVIAFLALVTYLSKVPVKMMVKGIKPLRFILILTFVLNLFFLQGETPLLNLGFAVITKEALITAVHYSLRLVLLVMISSLLTLTTPPIVLTDGLERLLSPLRVIHFPAHEMAMMMSIALRFIPGNLIARAKAMVPLLVPLFVSAFRRAGDLAMAMEARCYHGGEGRTRLRVLKCERRDYIACAAVAALLALVILCGKVY